MFNLSLTACSFHLKKYNSRNNDIFYLNDKLDIGSNKDGETSTPNDVVGLFESFFNKYAQSVSDGDKQKTFNCVYEKKSCGETDNYRFLYAIIKSGNYGSSSEIKNIETQKIVYNKKANESEEKPFYLFIVIPKDTSRIKVQKGIFIFQNVGTYGVKTITTEYMQDYFSNNFNITLNCKTVAPKIFLEKVLKKDSINKLILTKNNRSNDSSDNLSYGYGVETRVLGNLRFSETVWQKIFSGFNHFMSGRFTLFEFESIEYSEVKVFVDIGGTQRTINMRNIDNLSVIERIPDEIKGLDGHPKKDELINHLQKVTDDYLKEMVLKIS